jgi:alpha-tubulin suppressor-like RCC1 family protein
VVEVAATDPEGDPIDYAYAWDVDGTDPEISDALVPAALTTKGELWTCSVTPRDEFGTGPAASVGLVVDNTPPSAPEVSVSPQGAVATDLLHCSIDVPSEDPDEDEITYSFEWFRDGSFIQTDSTVDWTGTAALEVWACTATPFDGTDEGPSDEDTVEVSLDAVPHLTSGRYHSCGMPFDGNWSCWGVADGSAQDYGQTTGSIPEVLFMVVAGRNHTCASSLQGQATGCWGDNALNQTLANNSFFMHVAAGYDHTCAVGFDGSVVCWGSTTWWTSSPPSEPTFAVTGGDEFSCALKADFSVACWWGDTPVQFADPPGEWQQIDAGGKHLCGVRSDGTAECFGDDTYGQVSGLPSALTFEHVSAGHRHSCGVEAGTGAVHCWGQDTADQVSGVPTGAFVTVDAGWSQSCGARDNGAFECWGCVGDDRGQCSP